LIFSNGGTGVLTNIATSSLGLKTTDVAEGSNLYWTNARFDSRLSATTSLPNIITLANLSLPATQLTNFGVPFYQYLSATTTDALQEGNTNLYFTSDRVAGVIAGTTTDALAQGSINKYYSTDLFAADLAGTTTDALQEGTSHLYWTDDRFDSRLSATTSLP